MIYWLELISYLNDLIQVASLLSSSNFYLKRVNMKYINASELCLAPNADSNSLATGIEIIFNWKKLSWGRVYF